MAQNLCPEQEAGQRSALLGARLELDGDSGPYRTCPSCGSCHGLIGSGAGPHALSVICDGCDRHISWLSKRAVRALEARAIERGGRIDG